MMMKLVRLHYPTTIRVIVLLLLSIITATTSNIFADEDFIEQLSVVLRNDDQQVLVQAYYQKSQADAAMSALSSSSSSSYSNNKEGAAPSRTNNNQQQDDEESVITGNSATTTATVSSAGAKQQTTVEILIALYPDLFPQDFGFILSTITGGIVIAEQPVGFLDASATDQLYTQVVQVTEGANYNLTILDAFGDGLEAPGFFGIYYGGDSVQGRPEEELYTQIGFMGSTSTRLFTVTRPDTMSPTTSPQPSTSPQPTHNPTICIPVEDNAGDIVDTERDFTPIFQTDNSVYGERNNPCSSHMSYTDCTNERSEDCQWQFLGTSRRRGTCRIDPIAACIRDDNCQCDTADFNGGSATMAKGLLFHAPISVTARDIGPFQLGYYETYTMMTDSQQNADHRQDDSFFISRVDFTSRQVTYEFQELVNTDVFLSLLTDFSLAFKLHYLYWDTPMVGDIWSGVGSQVSIDGNDIIINGHSYTLPTPMKQWTCTSIVITSSTLYVGRTITIRRDLKKETVPTETDDAQILLGPFTGELFDVRVYNGALSWTEIREFGARCTSPDDPAALQYKRDIENPYYVYGCEPDFGRLPADEGGPVPTSGEFTYGSGAFVTLWLRPRANPFDRTEYIDIPEGDFDEEHYFQQAKIQSYLWEKFLFHIDMISFNQAPYRDFTSEDQVPQHSATFWNNPCRHLHNFNNGWQFPFYGKALGKWIAEEHGIEDDIIPKKDQVFDLGTLYRNRAEWAGITFVAHELFHGVQGHIADVYAGSPSRWMAESTAEFGADISFPAARKIIAPLTISPSYPMGMIEFRDAERGEHFMSDELSINEWVRGGHLYGGWVLWWFLAEHAGLLHLVGEAYSNWFQKSTYTAGELFYLRELVENANMDFGDVWSTCIAHMRTWDFPEFGPLYEIAEQEDFEKLMDNPDIVPPIDRSITLENRKTTVNIDPVEGTKGDAVAGPMELRPGPNGWNCLTMKDVAPDSHVSIKLEWDDGMGFDSKFKPKALPLQQAACDEDVRFYNSVVVIHNKGTGARRYWKLKGKAPATLNVSTGSNGPVMIYILLVPTPPSDYVTGIVKEENGRDGRAEPIPMYSYQYSVEVFTEKPSGSFRPRAPMEYGIMQFEPATRGWWPVECTCLEDPDEEDNRCVRPTFEGIPSGPSTAPTTQVDGPELIPMPPPGPSGVFCFAGDSLVDVKGKGNTPMKDLQLGDQVRVEGENIYSQVYSFGHRHETVIGEYLRVVTDDQTRRPLTVSPDHIVFLANGHAVPSSNLEVGDKLEAAGSEQTSTIVSIEQVVREGAYAPFTYSGTILVNGIKTSSYVAFQDSPTVKIGKSITTPFHYHWMAHASQLPHRYYCALHCCTTETYNDDGVSMWVARPHAMAQWLVRQHPILIALLMIPILVVLALFSLIGYII